MQPLEAVKTPLSSEKRKEASGSPSSLSLHTKFVKVKMNASFEILQNWVFFGICKVAKQIKVKNTHCSTSSRSTNHHLARRMSCVVTVEAAEAGFLEQQLAVVAVVLLSDVEHI